MYGVYAVVMKKRVGNEDRVNMPLFFGFVGVFNLILLWPGFVVLHFTGIETFELPPTGKIWTVVLVSAYLSSWRLYADNDAAELSHIICERLLLGIRHAPDNAFDCVRRAVSDDSHVAGRADHSQFAVCQSTILAWRGCGGPLVPLHQPRES